MEIVTGLRYTLCETQCETLWSVQQLILYVKYVMTPNSVVFSFLYYTSLYSYVSLLCCVCHAQTGHSTDRDYSWKCAVHAAGAVSGSLLYLRIVIGCFCPQNGLFSFPVYNLKLTLCTDGMSACIEWV